MIGDLEKLIRSGGISRKKSIDKTEECPVWNSWDGFWMESDEQLRNRIKKRVKIGIDGNAIFVGLGDMPEGKFHFREIVLSTPFLKAPILYAQKISAYEKWCELFPEEGRLPFDMVDL